MHYPKAVFFLNLFNWLPCVRGSAPSHALRSPHNLSGTPCRLPLQGGCKMSREIAPANHKTVAPRSKIRYTIKKENAL